MFASVGLSKFGGAINWISPVAVKLNKAASAPPVIANAAGNKNNEFSNCLLAKEIFQHHREWVIKLNEYRAEIIHYNLKCGNAKKKMSVDNVKGTMKVELMLSLPDDLVKLLSLEKCKQNENGVDMQFGAIEIAKRSTTGIKSITKTALTKCTTNSIIFKE